MSVQRCTVISALFKMSELILLLLLDSDCKILKMCHVIYSLFSGTQMTKCFIAFRGCKGRTFCGCIKGTAFLVFFLNIFCTETQKCDTVHFFKYKYSYDPVTMCTCTCIV